jgi:hypothetical protein
MPTPLYCRVPRPPPIFVGRDDELAWLDAALGRGNLALLAGWAGIGKSALVAAWCARGRVDDAVCLRAEGIRSVYAQLCGVWGEATDPTDIDGCVFGIIQGVERHGHHLIIEDAHGFAASEELVRLVTDFAKWHTGPGRLIVLSRTRVAAPAVAEQSLWLPPLSDERVEELMRRCAPGELGDRLPALVRSAHGSPLEARRLLDGSSGTTPAQLGDLPAVALALASVISSVDRLPLSALGAPLAETCSLLSARRLVEQDRDSVWVPDAHRAIFPQPPPAGAEAIASTIAESLIAGGVREWRWAALVLARSARRLDLADRLLSEVDEGFADVVGSQRLFDTLEGLSSDAALRMRLLCVYSSPWQHGLRWLAELPAPTEARAQLAYSLALFAANEISRAEAVLRDVAAHREDVQTRLEALLGLVKIADDHHLPDLQQRLSTLDLALESDRLRRDIWLGYSRYRVGDRRAGQNTLRAVFARRHMLGNTRPTSALELYQAQVFLSIFGDAQRLAEEEALSRRLSPRWAYLAAVIAVETCNESERAKQLARLEQVAAGSMRYEFLVAYLHERHAEHVDLSHARRELLRMWTIAESIADARFLADCRLYELELAIYDAARPHERMLADDGMHGALVSLVRLRMEGLDGGAAAHADNGGWQAVLVAERLWQGGDAARALSLLEAAIAEAQQRHAVLEEADLRAAQAHLVLRWPAVDSETSNAIVAQLLEFSERHGLAEGRRLALGTRLLTSLTRPTNAALREVADGTALIARLARVLLGEQEAAWKCDRDAIDVASGRWGSGASPQPSPLLLDGELFTARVASGEQLELGNHRLLYRILEMLVKAPKGVTKERLAREVWSLASYRPERDDKRIQVAIARLRSLIASAGFPISVSTTPTGYSVAIAVDAG